MGFIVSSRAFSIEEQTQIQSNLLDQLNLISSSLNFVRETIYLMLSSAREMIIKEINKRTGLIADCKKIKYVETNTLVKNLTIYINTVVCTPSPFYDNFSYAEEQGSLYKVR